METSNSQRISVIRSALDAMADHSEAITVELRLEAKKALAALDALLAKVSERVVALEEALEDTTEALELAAVRPGGKCNVQGMNVEKHAGTIRDLTPAELGIDPLDCVREPESGATPVVNCASSR